MEGNVEGMMKRPEGLGSDEAAEQEKWYATLHLIFLVGEDCSVLYKRQNRQSRAINAVA